MKVLTIMLSTLLVLYCLIIPQSYCRRTPNPFLWTDKRDCFYFMVARTTDTEQSITQATIVDYHNTLRSTVDPPASNMLRMEWHKKVAKAAKKRALECTLVKTEDKEPCFEALYNEDTKCGHNIYVTNQLLPWKVVIRYWFSKRETFRYNVTGKEHPEILPYVQMVRAGTHQIGCYMTTCSDAEMHLTTYHYVCTYYPIGSTFKRPYKDGNWCSSCEKNCYEGRLCSNQCFWPNIWNNCDNLTSTIDNFCHAEKNNWEQCPATCACGKDKIYEEDWYLE